MTDSTFQWADSSQSVLLRGDGACVPVDPNNSDYAAFLASGVKAAPPPEPPTAIEKLAAAGLTVEELKKLLAS